MQLYRDERSKESYKDGEAYEYYAPIYYELSACYTSWVKLFAADVHRLKIESSAHFAFKQQPAMAHVRVRYWLNHPIAWVQLVGIVVSVDERETHGIATCKVHDG